MVGISAAKSRFLRGRNTAVNAMQLRAAVVGAGLMGRWHAYYAAAVGSEIAAVVDPDPGARAALAARHRGAAGFADLEECFTATRIDVVHVCTPTVSHAELCTVALDAGKHVLVEKPLAESSMETRRLVRLAAERDVLLNPVHQFPFQHGVRRVRERATRLGRLVELSFVAHSAGGTGKTAEERRAILFEILPHPLSLFRALNGTLADVSWRFRGSPPYNCQL